MGRQRTPQDSLSSQGINISFQTYYQRSTYLHHPLTPPRPKIQEEKEAQAPAALPLRTTKPTRIQPALLLKLEAV